MSLALLDGIVAVIQWCWYKTSELWQALQIFYPHLMLSEYLITDVNMLSDLTMANFEKKTTCFKACQVDRWR